MGKRRNSGKPDKEGRKREYKGATKDEVSSPHTSERHPSHLKGKEIGLFYRDKGKEKRKDKLSKPLCKISLPDWKKQQIRKMLCFNSVETSLVCDDDKTYSYIEDSVFKRKFLSTIRGSLVERIQSSTLKIERNKNIDKQYLDEYLSKVDNPRYIELRNARQNLPAYKEREQILRVIEENQVVLISGDTGCGKTTQVSQFILDDYIEKNKGSICSVACCQPRRLSAISVAERVADERVDKLGNSVGYLIRMEGVSPRETGSILFCTTGIILRRMESDPALSKITHLIIDEIHERNVMSDFLLTILKDIVKKRKDLKVILMSATLNAEEFSKYFNGCIHMNIPGSTYGVTEYYLEDVLQLIHNKWWSSSLNNKTVKKPWHKNRKDKGFTDFVMPFVRNLKREGKHKASVCEFLSDPASENLNLDLILALVIYICKAQYDDEGSILVFLPGLSDISELNRRLEESGQLPRSHFKIIALHSNLPTIEQKSVFSKGDRRKIILSTNVAETSITIEDVTYVIDSGKMKVTNINLETNQQTLESTWIARANADQRRGRAGRVKPGVCYHMYTRARHMILEPFLKPEVLRMRLESTILSAKILQLGDIAKFFEKLMDPPDPRTVQTDLDLLKRLNALDDNEDLTPLGYHLGRLPIAPQMGKMILFGAIFSCLDPILSIAASLDFKDPFYTPLYAQWEADKKKKLLSHKSKSDHILLYNVLSGYESTYNVRDYCYRNYLSMPKLRQLSNMKQQFMKYLYDLKFVKDLDPKCYANNHNSANLSLVKAVICAGLYPNVAILDVNAHGRVKTLRSVDLKQSYKFHPKSVLAKENFVDSPFIVYYLKVKTTNDFIHDATIVHPLSIIFFGDKYELSKERNKDFITVNQMKFLSDNNTIKIISDLRARMNCLLEWKITHPGFVNWTQNSDDIKILRAIMELITTEAKGIIPNIQDSFDKEIG